MWLSIVVGAVVSLIFASTIRSCVSICRWSDSQHWDGACGPSGRNDSISWQTSAPPTDVVKPQKSADSWSDEDGQRRQSVCILLTLLALMRLDRLGSLIWTGYTVVITEYDGRIKVPLLLKYHQTGVMNKFRYSSLIEGLELYQTHKILWITLIHYHTEEEWRAERRRSFLCYSCSVKACICVHI